MTTALLARKPPRPRLFRVAHRIAERMGPDIVAAFEKAVAQAKAGIDMAGLEAAVAGGNLSVIEAQIVSSRITAIMLGDDALRAALEKTAGLTGEATADVVSEASGVSMSFRARDPNVVIYAREQAGELIAAVGDDVKEAVRIIVAAGADLGLTVEQQARAIREVVGLRPQWANAPTNLGQEIREGRSAAATVRRLSAADKAQIRSRIARGTVDEAFITKMQDRYTASLLNRRALDIARTEGLDAAHFGQQEAWRQAVDQGALPADVRQVPVVTPDDRLRETHAAIPGLNPGGVELGGVFKTPFGDKDRPPWEPNCRCGIALTWPGRKGVL